MIRQGLVHIGYSTWWDLYLNPCSNSFYTKDTEVFRSGGITPSQLFRSQNYLDLVWGGSGARKGIKSKWGRNVNNIPCDYDHGTAVHIGLRVQFFYVLLSPSGSGVEFLTPGAPKEMKVHPYRSITSSDRLESRARRICVAVCSPVPLVHLRDVR